LHFGFFKPKCLYLNHKTVLSTQDRKTHMGTPSYAYRKTSYYTDNEPIIESKMTSNHVGFPAVYGQDNNSLTFDISGYLEKTIKAKGRIPDGATRVQLPPRSKLYIHPLVIENNTDRRKWYYIEDNEKNVFKVSKDYTWVTYLPFRAPPPLDPHVTSIENPETYNDYEYIGPKSLPVSIPFNLPYYKKIERKRDFLLKIL